MSDRAIALEKNWRFRAVDPRERADFAAHRYPEKLATAGWEPATVPGCVHFDLLRAGKIPDPYTNSRERESYWIESQDFLYKTNFLLPDDWALALGRTGQRVELSFESLETFASVWFNGHFLGESLNQFLPASFDITSHIRNGENVVVVHFESASKRCTEMELKHGRLDAAFDRTRVYARRSPYLTGWSMAPRLSGCGIWGKVVVRRIDRARMHSVSVPIKGLSTSLARVGVEVEFESLQPQDLDLEMQIEKLDPIGSGTNYDSQVVWEKIKPVKVKTGRFRFTEDAKIFEPVLWWPVGYGSGRRTLYRARVAVRSEGEVIHSVESIFGLRKVDLVSRTNEGTGTFYFLINGQQVFVRGAVWVPPDMFPPRVPDTQVRTLLDLAAAANINLLRVWGGGIYESEAFYRRCDELGIMVWQDFVFAQGDYPDFREYWKSCQEEAKHQVRRLRNHPSLVLWCGNDGIAMLHHEQGKEEAKTGGSKIFTRLLPHVLKEYDVTRPYWPSTPFGGADPNSEREGDHRHLNVWDRWASVDSYRNVHARFVSSFGFQSLPSEDVIARFTKERDKTLTHEDFDAHQKEPEGNARLFRYLLARTRPPENFEELVYLSQWTQGDALSLAIDSWRANKPETMGTTVWHFNDCWPGITWSLVDAAGTPKLAFWMVRQAFESTSLILLPAEDGFRAVAVHDGPPWKGDQGFLCRLKAFTLDGQPLDWVEKEIDLPSNGKAELGLFTLESLGIKHAAKAVVVGELLSGRKVTATRLYAPVEPKKAHYPVPNIECTLDVVIANRRAVFQLRSTNIVRGVEFRCEGLDPTAVRFDNGFDLWPGREVWVHVDVPPDMDRETLKRSVRFRSLNDVTGGRTLAWRQLDVQEPEEEDTEPAFSTDDLPLGPASSDELPNGGYS